MTDNPLNDIVSNHNRTLGLAARPLAFGKALRDALHACTEQYIVPRYISVNVTFVEGATALAWDNKSFHDIPCWIVRCGRIAFMFLIANAS